MPRELSRASRPRTDPTRTATLRRLFTADIKRRYTLLARDVRSLIIEEDSFGLDRVPFALNARWDWLSLSGKLESFWRWLEAKVLERILKMDIENYIKRAYEQGIKRAFDDIRKPALHRADLFEAGKREFLFAVLGRTRAVERLRFLITKAFGDLKGITQTMIQQVQRELSEGFLKNMTGKQIVTEIFDRIDKIGIARSLIMARSEIVRAHAEGQLDAYSFLDIDNVSVMVETAGDGLVCPICESEEGVIYTVEESHGLIPFHANCRCAFVPVRRY